MITKGNTVVSLLTGRAFKFNPSSKESKRNAVAKLQADDATKIAEIEARLGRPLTEREKRYGTIDHKEERSKSDLLRRDMTVQKQPEAPENPHRAAADWMRSREVEKNLSPRERGIMAAEQAADELDARRKAVAEREAISRDPKVIAAVRELTEFVSDVKFSPCNQELVERAESLLARARAGDLDNWEAERDAIGESIYESVYAGELSQSESELQAKRERASYWKPKPPESKPSESDERGFTLADLQRSAEMRRQSAETQRVENKPASNASDADDDWGIDAAFDEMIAMVRAIPTRDEPARENGGETNV